MTCTADAAIETPSAPIAPPDQEIVETGKTFADALRLMRQAKFFAFVVPYTGRDNRSGHVTTSRAKAESFFRDWGAPDNALHSRLIRFNNGHCWLFVGDFDISEIRS